MAAVLQREVDAYQDAIDKYNREARRYESAASKHNEAINVYRSSWVTDSKGEVRAYNPAEVTYKVPLKPNHVWYDLGRQGKTYMTAMRKIADDVTQQEAQTAMGGKSMVSPDAATKLKTPDGRYIFAQAPGDFTMEQPASPGAAPSLTTAQLKKLNEPSLTDIERNQPSGLISTAFNS